MKPRIGSVSIGDIETVSPSEGSRIPETRPDIDAQAPEVDDEAPAGASTP